MNYFQRFQIPAAFALDESLLERRYQQAIRAVHPDLFARASVSEKAMALRMSSQINDAYTTLKDPLLRATYLCQLHGYEVEAETNTRMPMDFMMRQMQWRETLDESKDPQRLQALVQEVADHEVTLVARLGRDIDEEGDFASAVVAIRQWLFVRKMQQSLRERFPQRT